MKKLSVIIVNYNVCHFLEQALVSVRKAIEGIEAEVFVVDNNSVDGSGKMVREKFDFVTLIENKENLGFSKANNQAMRLSTGKYVLLLNPDTIVEEDTFHKCIDFMDHHPEAGGLGVKMLDGAGKFLPESKRGLPTPWVAFYKIFGLATIFPKSKKFGGYHLGYLDKDKTNPVTVLSGAYMFMRKTALDKTGLLDETFFMYGEDIDLSYRMIKAGYQNYYFPETRIIHYKGESTKKTSINYVFIFYKAMIIFAQKHFSQKNAGIFSFLINIAIYIRATMALSMRFLKMAALPAIDATVIYTGMFFLKTFWENTYKKEPGKFPPEYMAWVVPTYIIIWLVSVYFNSGYSKKIKPHRIIRGILVGTILISLLSNFVDDYRYSKAMILLGSVYSIISMLGIRSIFNFIRYKTISLGDTVKKILVIGKAEESTRIIKLLKENYYHLEVAGYINPEPEINRHEFYLGDTQHLNEAIMIHKIDEMVFCSKDIPANYIIECMTRTFNRNVEYKIVAEGSEYIIGSSSKNTKGDFYTLNIQLNIIKEENIRSKRIVDVMVGLMLLPVSPILMWLMANPKGFVKNIFEVLLGHYSWVGFNQNLQIKLPPIKKGIITPVLEKELKDISRVARKNFLYARDYNPYIDLKLILLSFRRLGS
ncbi:MAG TPA: glycosyltransferase [Cytophagaceae bacterium]|nr:glycosyltransferase [Cytophagaceae bacterium]